MSFESASSTPFRCFVLADSHAKSIPQVASTPSHHLNVTSISGLKWIDDYKHHLSAIHQLHSPNISTFIASCNAIMFLIGSNSLRIFPAHRVINHVQNVITVLRESHSHFSSRQSICIVATFPCGKPSKTFPTPPLLQQNIDFYNAQLQSLSVQLNVTVIDFNVQSHHLSPDDLHLHRNFSHIISHNIFNYFHTFASCSPIHVPRQISRSAAVVKHRNQRRYARRRQVNLSQDNTSRMYFN